MPYGLACLNWVGCPIWIYTREQNWALVSTFTCTLRTHMKVYVRHGHSPGMLATKAVTYQSVGWIRAGVARLHADMC